LSDTGDQVPRGLPRLEHGSVFAGYWIDGLLDRGGMGVVYKAIDVDLDRAVALKLIAPEYTQDETAVARFKAESRLAASLEHPNIVPVHRGGEENGVLYLAMRFVPGTNLRHVIDRSAIPLNLTSEIITQVSDALDAAHARGLVHRDVKPANILISDETVHTHAYLTDFGLTKRPGSTGNLTGTGLWVGTADYVAPEQIQGHQIDGRADIYSLGCVLYEMLTGEVAYPKDGDIAKLWAHISNPPPQPSASRAELAPFDHVVAKATAKDPADRYASAGEMAAAVREVVAQQQGSHGPQAMPAGGAGVTGPPVTVPPAPPTFVPTGSAPASQTPYAPPPPSVPGPQTPYAAPPPSSPASQTPYAPPGSQPPYGPPSATAPPPERSRGRRRVGLLALVGVLAAAAVVAVVLLVSGGSKDTSTQAARTAAPESPGQKLTGGLGPVPTNHVTGSGNVLMRLNGDELTVTLNASGLLDNKHAMHIHAGALGECPPASAAKDHNGHRTISTLDGVPFYGPPVTALTTRGDTSKRSILAFSRFPNGGTVHYTRQNIKVSPVIAANIRNGDAVAIVHGIDYDHDGTYGNVLDRSDLDRSLPGEITAPALCGRIVPATSSSASGGTKTSQVPGRGTLFAATLQPQPASIAALCYLGAAQPGDRARGWDA
jgi:serine/threonine protein kinase